MVTSKITSKAKNKPNSKPKRNRPERVNSIPESVQSSRLLPSGNFSARRSVLCHGESLTGSGIFESRLWLSEMSVPAIDVASDPGRLFIPGFVPTPQNIRHCNLGVKISDLAILSPGGGIGVNISGVCQNVTFENVLFHSLGIAARINTKSTVRNIQFRNCIFQNCGVNLVARAMGEDSRIESIQFIDCISRYSKTHLVAKNYSLNHQIDGIFWDRGSIQMPMDGCLCELHGEGHAIRKVIFDSAVIRGPISCKVTGAALSPEIIRSR